MRCGESAKASKKKSAKVLKSQVGDGVVGKNSLILSYKNNQFPQEDLLPTMFDKFDVNGMTK